MSTKSSLKYSKSTACVRFRREGFGQGRWVLLDYGDVVVHVQHQEDRIFYALERLWADGPVIELPEELSADQK